MKPTRVIVAGTRTFSNYELLRAKLDFYLSRIENVEIVSGGQRGADSLGERYARERSMGLAIFEAEWQKYGKKAGPIRNGVMAAYATHCVVFWDGESPGAASMIRIAKVEGLNLRVVRYKEEAP